MNTLVSSKITNNKPIKCTLTRIEEEFSFNNYSGNTWGSIQKSIVKNYVYDTQRRLIA